MLKKIALVVLVLKPCDLTTHTEGLFAVSRDSRAEVERTTSSATLPGLSLAF